MGNRLSHSAINRYLTCAESYRLHYQKRIRTTEIGSALIFGSAIGRAIEFALNPACTDLPNIASAKQMFDYQWQYQEVNGVLTNLEECNDIVYSKYDHDPELADSPYESLRVKGHLILDAFDKKFLPLVTKVWSTEEKIELTNDEGDSSIGFIDTVISMKGYDVPIILDFKTAARRYEEDSVQKSVQLAQYMHAVGSKYVTRLAGYAVFLKAIVKNRQKVCTVCSFDGSGSRFKTCANETTEGKRCGGEWIEKTFPEAEMQLLIDTIPERFEEFIIDNIASVNHAIKAEVFVKNVNSCLDAGWGRPCEFYGYCHKGTMEGLTVVQEKAK